jgi:integrase/recombinase XerD
MLFDCLVTGPIIPVNQAHSVRGPRHSMSKGATSVLSSEEATVLFTNMDISSVVGLRDRAILAVMIYTFAGVGAVVALNLEDYFPRRNARGFACPRKTAKSMKCPAITSSKPISMPTASR